MELFSQIIVRFLVILFFLELSLSCQSDTHMNCGEVLVWDDIRSPKTTVIEVRLPTSLPDQWSTYFSTCHENTTASTSIKLFDHCPLTVGQYPRSAVATNSRDASCRVADRASSLEYFPKKDKFKTYFVAVTAGAVDGPEAGSVYRVSLHLSCLDEFKVDLRPATSEWSVTNDLDMNEHVIYDNNDKPRAVNQGINSKGSIQFARRLAVTDNPTLAPSTSSAPSISQGPSLNPSELPTSSPSLSSHPSFLPSSVPTSIPSSAPTPIPSSAPTLLPSSLPTLTPTSTIHPSQLPTFSPSISTLPSTLPTTAPTFRIPSPLPTSVPSSLPTITPLPSPVPTLDVCKFTNATCGNIVAGNTTGQNDFIGAVGGELMYLMRATSAQRLRLTACPTDSSFVPALRIYDGCPNEGGVELGASNNTIKQEANGTWVVVAGECASLKFDISYGTEGLYWIVVDGALDGYQGAFELTTLCESIEPTPRPTAVPIPQPTAVPSPPPSVTSQPSQVPVLAPTPQPTTPPSSAPTSLPARENCACFSENMIANIELYCPHIISQVVEGCMANVTRAALTVLSQNCTALKADWGPFFQFADDDYGSVPGYPTYD